MTVEAAVADARLAVLEFDDARAWLERARQKPLEPLAAEVWVTEPSYRHILLVRHRVRGWVPPGGTVEPGETPRAAAARELAEETGVPGELLPVPAAVTVCSYRATGRRRWACPTSPSSAARCRSVGKAASLRSGSTWRRTGAVPSPRTATASARTCADWRRSTRSVPADVCRQGGNRVRVEPGPHTVCPATSRAENPGQVRRAPLCQRNSPR
ncbi:MULTISPECIES: NUDIX domain-containing protein [unclassified Crossiella]|uniref:NUDIX domain-containing protein n=1 Tax=unclassified Crossiella TaxID=2620835 RepID=UPI0027E54940|nr:MULTISPECIES: NUDIX domain-containing protein [unclassified Crossiella]